MKPKLIKKESIKAKKHKPKRPKKPFRSYPEETRLRIVLARWMEIVDNPHLHQKEYYLLACNEALNCVAAIKAIHHEEMKAEIKESRRKFAILVADEAASVKSKKKCKLPKASGHGLRVEPKDTNIRKGRGPTPGSRATIKTVWPDLSKGPVSHKPSKGDNVYESRKGGFRSWIDNPYRKK